MSRTLWSVAAGVLALIALDVFTQTGTASGVSSATGVLTQWLNRFMSPEVGLIPDHSATAPAPPPPTGTTGYQGSAAAFK